MTSPDCRLAVIAFDFDQRTSTEVDAGDLPAVLRSPAFVWIDVEYTDGTTARSRLAGLGVLGIVPDDVAGAEAVTTYSRYDAFLHLTLADCRFDTDGGFSLARIDVLVTENALITLHAGRSAVIDMVRADCRADFQRFAQSPSFMIYELWDHLIERYIETQKRLERVVQGVQAELFRDRDDAVFGRLSAIGGDLLEFRAVLVPARAALHEMATRRTLFVSDATRAALLNMIGTLEHVLQDVLVDRDILSQSMSLHMSMVAHRTNRAMNKLTVISAIFLPLTFLCGVYGMNFEFMPELAWHFGYPLFWILCGIIVLVLVGILRHNQLL